MTPRDSLIQKALKGIGEAGEEGLSISQICSYVGVQISGSTQLKLDLIRHEGSTIHYRQEDSHYIPCNF